MISEDETDHNQHVLATLNPWNSTLLRKDELPFAFAAESLLSDTPIVEAKRVSAKHSSKWMLNIINSKEIATFTYTGLWSWGSNMETGNFVPLGETAPPGVSDDRIQRIPSFKCDVSFAFDTTADDTLWRCMNAIDAHMNSIEDFNQGKKPRRTWQDGKDPSMMEKYLLSAKIFLKKSPLEHVPPATYDVHPWIQNALNQDQNFVANPDRPRCYELVGRTAVRLEDTNEPHFRKNDIVRMAFVVHIHVGLETWHPEIVPIELMRVGKISPMSTQVATTKQPTNFPTIANNFQHLEPGEEISFFQAPVRENKRKAPDSDEERQEFVRASKRRAKKHIVDSDAMDDSEDIAEPVVKPKIRISLKGKEKERN